MLVSFLTCEYFIGIKTLFVLFYFRYFYVFNVYFIFVTQNSIALSHRLLRCLKYISINQRKLRYFTSTRF